MSEKAKEILGVETLTTLADKGYYEGQDIGACEAAWVICMAAKPKPGGVKKEEGFTRGDFVYNREKDFYDCSGQNRLQYMRNQKQSDGTESRV
jgi:hypothetical protein